MGKHSESGQRAAPPPARVVIENPFAGKYVDRSWLELMSIGEELGARYSPNAPSRHSEFPAPALESYGKSRGRWRKWRT